MPDLKPITKFSGQYEYLSNFYACQVMYEGVMYPSSEHAFQAAKTLDRVARRDLAKIDTAGKAKKAGRSLQLRKDWLEVRVQVMLDILRDKFTRNVALGRWLLGTGSADLVEGNTWGDTFWGVYNGQGENKLGQALVRVRAELREQC